MMKGGKEKGVFRRKTPFLSQCDKA